MPYGMMQTSYNDQRYGEQKKVACNHPMISHRLPLVTMPTKVGPLHLTD